MTLTVTPKNQNKSARNGLIAGECSCGWVVLSNEAKCPKCRTFLAWGEGKPTANEITAELLMQIPKQFPSIRVWRNNRVEAKAVGRGGQMRRVSAGIDGQADISGIVGPLGRRLEIEVKAGKDRMRDTQHAFRRMIESHGGVYIIARDVEECLLELVGYPF